MRYYMAMFLLLSLTIGCDGDGPLKPGEFEDPAFAKCVEKILQIYIDNNLILADDPDKYNKIDMLGCGEGGIRSIKGIENMPNLDEIEIIDNEIESLEPLRTLTKLEFLKLNNNKIKDLEPLSGLTELISLYLYDNYIENILPLCALTQIHTVGLSGNCIVDVNQFRELEKCAPEYSSNGAEDYQNPEKCQ